MVYLAIGLSLASLIIGIATLISVKRNKSVTEISKQDKTELKDSFSSSVKIIADALETSNKKSGENVILRLENMDKQIFKNGEIIETRLEKAERSQIEQLENIRLTIERNVLKMQEGNEKKLSEIKQTVDEKLTETLNNRFKESFKYLTDELEKVTRTVGEMQSISKDVGSLTKALTNVKTSGIFGEIRLGSIIEQILPPEQYLKNVVTNSQSKDPVEFAVKMPGGNDGEVLMPIDSKFPYTVYTDMQNAYEKNDFAAYEERRKELVQRIKSMAKDIKEKYVCPPATTNFAIMFLPVEGLYAEVVKQGLVEELQAKYSVTVAGPTTMAALLNSLQMGFQTLSIQKKSNEVWRVLNTVKCEFEKFNDILVQIQNRLNVTSGDLDKLIGVRTRAINRTLKDVTTTAAGAINYDGDAQPKLDLFENE